MLGELAAPAHAALEVLACEPEWAALATEIGGNLVSAESATTPQQDPHYIQARPSLIAKVRRAALGDLHGRRPRSRLAAATAAPGRQRRRCSPGQPGNLNAADYVELLDKPSSVDRSLGDVHPYGNPHIQTDPRNIGKVAAALADRLAMLDPAPTRRRTSNATTISRSAGKPPSNAGRRAIAPLKGKQIVTHHKGWAYLENWAGLVEVGNLEPKPGLPPSAAHLAELLDQLKGKHVAVIVRSIYEDAQGVRVARRAGPQIPYVVLPHTVGSVPGTDDLFGMFDVMVKTLAGGQAGESSTPQSHDRRPGAVAGVLVLATHVPLGREVLKPRHHLHRLRGRADGRAWA